MGEIFATPDISHNREGCAAAAARNRVRVFDFEFGADESLIEFNGRAVEIGHGDSIRYHRVREGDVFVRGFIGQFHFIQEARTAAAIHGDAEFQGVLALLRAEFFNALYRAVVNNYAHGGIITHTRYFFLHLNAAN